MILITSISRKRKRVVEVTVLKQGDTKVDNVKQCLHSIQNKDYFLSFVEDNQIYLFPAIT